MIDQPPTPMPSTSPARQLLVPVSEDALTLLRQCEHEIADGLEDFLRVGRALAQIAQQKLFRVKDHTTFVEYCHDRWGLSRRNAYLKVQVAGVYEEVHNCALPPYNEYQLRQLLLLPTPALRRTAWERAVAMYQKTGKALTGAAVRDTVKAVAVEQEETPWTVWFMPDGQFPGIPYRWEVLSTCFRHPEQFVSRLRTVPTDSPRSELPGANPVSEPRSVVLVSPDADLAESAVSDTDLGRFVQMCGTAPEYQFVLWTAQPQYFHGIIGWPANVEVAVRVVHQPEIDQLATIPVETVPVRALWILPGEALTLPSPFPYQRVLVGHAACDPERWTDEQVAACRSLMAHVLQEACGVHLAPKVCDACSRPSSVSSPCGEKPTSYHLKITLPGRR